MFQYPGLGTSWDNIAMPNWCFNNVSVSHPDPAMIKKFKAKTDSGELFRSLIPPPPDVGNADHWGTKWDVDDGSFTIDSDGLSGFGGFNTAWAAPIPAYEKLAELGFQINATYHEPGMTFAGAWSNENGNQYF